MPLLWRSPSLRDDATTARFITCLSAIMRVPSHLASVGQYIRELALFSHHWTDARLLDLLPAIPLLDRLHLHSGTGISDTSFQYLPQHCPHLRSLQLDATCLTQVAFAALGRHCTKLCDLEWSPSIRQSVDWLAVLHSCPLVCLRLVLLPTAMDAATMMMLQRFGDLTCLEISLSVPAVMTPLLLGNCDWPRLTKLALGPCTGIDNTTWLYFIQHHRQLQHVELADGSELTDASLDAMVTGLPALMSLTLTRNAHITTNGLRRFVRQCAQLRAVTVYRCEWLIPDEFPEARVRSKLIMVLDRKAIEKIKHLSIE